MNDRKPTPTDAELSALLAQANQEAEEDALLAKKNRRNRILLVAIAVVGTLIGGFIGIVTGLVCAGIIIADIFKAKKPRLSVKAQIAGPLTEQVLTAVFGQADYRPQQHIPLERIREADMGFSFYWNRIAGSDYISATHRDVRVQLSDVQLIEEEEFKDSEGNVTNRTHTHFRGQWIICEFEKRLSANLTLTERRGGLLGLKDKAFPGKKEILTENDTFNKRFRICADSSHDAFYILTPHVIEHLLQLDDKANGTTCMCFLRDGKLHVSLDTGRNLFEIRDLKNAAPEALRQRFMKELCFLTGLLDELLDNETLFAGNQR